MSHRQRIAWPQVQFLWLLWVLATTVTLLVVLTGCKSEDTRPPNDTDVMREHAAPCRCGVRPTLESAR